MTLFAELKRRNVIRMGGLYLVGAWLLVQVSSTVLPMFGAPAWLPRGVVIVLAIGLLPALLFSWVFELTAQGLKRDAEVGPEDSIAPQTAQRLNRAIIAVLLLALAYFGFDKFVLAPRREAAQVSQATHSMAERAAAHPTRAIDAKSIAVLPLDNESGNSEEQYFSDGLSEDLITALSQFDGLKVISRNSSFQFRDSKDDSRLIGDKLGVANLLEGSVRRAGDVVRVSAALVKAVDGSTLWSQHYDRPYKDLFKLQDDITHAVAAELKSKILTDAGVVLQSDRPPSGSLDAYSAYLQGKFYFTRGSETDLRKAIGQYAVAVRLDPRYALAWASSAHAGVWLAGEYLAGADAQRVNADARQAAETALSLEPNLSAAHSAHGELLEAVDFDWAGAEAEYRRALQLAPNNDVAIENLGSVLASRGQPGAAIEMLQQSLATDPLRGTGHLLLARYFASLGRFDEADRSIRKAIELQPASGIFDAALTVIDIQRGEANSALTDAQRTLPGIWRDYALAMALQVGHDRAAADAALALVVDRHAEGMAFQIAEIHALRRDPDRMFEWLDRAWINRDPGIQFLLVDPFVLRYRDDPRFAAFCRKVGFPTTTSARAMP